jgi:hypothetical protein
VYFTWWAISDRPYQAHAHFNVEGPAGRSVVCGGGKRSQSRTLWVALVEPGEQATSRQGLTPSCPSQPNMRLRRVSIDRFLFSSTLQASWKDNIVGISSDETVWDAPSGQGGGRVECIRVHWYPERTVTQKGKSDQARVEGAASAYG